MPKDAEIIIIDANGDKVSAERHADVLTKNREVLSLNMTVRIRTAISMLLVEIDDRDQIISMKFTIRRSPI